jgi:hypothetical protein
VAQLLFTAFMQLDAKDWYSGPSTAVTEAFTALPGATGIPYSYFLSLVEICLRRKDMLKLVPVLALPGARETPGKHLCALIDKAGQAGQLRLVPELCRCVVVWVCAGQAAAKKSWSAT